MEISMFKSVSLIYPKLKETMQEGSYKTLRKNDQTSQSIMATNGETPESFKARMEQKKEALFNLLSSNEKPSNESLSLDLGVSKSTIQRWNKEFSSIAA